jgi:TP53 regulating kinase and related kinases
MILAQGAEAVILKERDKVIKKRISKSYRISEIDVELRKQRTRVEARNLKKIKGIVNVPEVTSVSEEECLIEMDFIEGEKLSSCLEKEDYLEIAKQLGKDIAKLHKNNIIHGDLTTSNFILTPKKEIYYLDLGLSFHSIKIEDKAVDLHVLKEALEAKHYSIWKSFFKVFSESYGDKEVLVRLEKVELRGRNKAKLSP